MALIRAYDLERRVCCGSKFEAVGERLVKLLPNALHFFPRAAQARWSLGMMLNDRSSVVKGYHVLNLPVIYEGLQVITPRFLNRAHENGLWVNVWWPKDRRLQKQLLDSNVDGILFGATAPRLEHGADSSEGLQNKWSA